MQKLISLLAVFFFLCACSSTNDTNTQTPAEPAKPVVKAKPPVEPVKPAEVVKPIVKAKPAPAVYKHPLIKITTSKGVMIAELYEDKVPNTVASIIGLAE